MTPRRPTGPPRRSRQRSPGRAGSGTRRNGSAAHLPDQGVNQPAYLGRYRRKRNPSCSHSERSAPARTGHQAGAGQDPLGAASDSRGERVRHSSSRRPAAASCPLRLGPPSASSRANPAPGQRGERHRATSRSPAVITSARSAALLRSATDVPATVTTTGGTFAAAKRASPSRAGMTVISPRQAAARPVVFRADGSGRDEDDVGL